MIKALTTSFGHSIRGLKTTWKEERNFKIEVFISLLVIFLLYYFDFSYLEWALCIFAIGLVIVTEIFNTIIEDVCNKIELNHDPLIGKIKDMAAAGVLMSAITAGIVGVIVFYTHFS